MLCHRKSLGAGDWKCKSRLVVDGSQCVTGLHTAEVDISTSLPGWNAMRVLCSVAKGNGWMVYAGDVRTGFLKAEGSGIAAFMHMPVGLRKYQKAAAGSVEICKAIRGNLYGKAVSTPVNRVRQCGARVTQMRLGIGTCKVECLRTALRVRAGWHTSPCSTKCASAYVHAIRIPAYCRASTQ